MRDSPHGAVARRCGERLRMVFVATLLSCGTAGQWDTYCEWIDASGHAVIPHWMTRIGTRAGNQGTLMGCDNLTTVSIPNTVSLIGRSAFRFSGLESIVIPDSVTNIDNFGLGRHPGLSDPHRKIGLPRSATSAGVANLCHLGGVRQQRTASMWR
jgi:hypothetical protein